MRRGKAKVHKENNERWLLTYSDLITLLMIFFIILYAMSSTDARKFQDLTGALQQAFNNGAFQLITVGGTPGNPHTLSGATPGQQTQFQKIKAEIEAMSKELGLQQSVHVGASKEGLVISLAGNLLFYPGDVQLKPEASNVLKRLAVLVYRLPNDIRVEGNTDNQQPDGVMYRSNWELSSLRAVAIVEYLAGPGGLTPKRLQAEGLSQYHPVTQNATAAGRARNRRADIVILYP